MLQRTRAFTLIELLIVVAIIAILAAIAVPNFLEAQTRAKVSRMKSDLRSLATAIESYRIDTNRYPFGAEITDLTQPVTVDPFEGYASAVLTTPIAYITSLFRDTFIPRTSTVGEERAPVHFADRLQASSPPINQPNFFNTLTQALNGAPIQGAEWFTFSHGPDLDHDETIPAASTALDARLYDPTNGTVSSGDIYNFGPGVGFLR